MGEKRLVVDAEKKGVDPNRKDTRNIQRSMVEIA
jgi:hypothetical protein